MGHRGLVAASIRQASLQPASDVAEELMYLGIILSPPMTDCQTGNHYFFEAHRDKKAGGQELMLYFFFC